VRPISSHFDIYYFYTITVGSKFIKSYKKVV